MTSGAVAGLAGCTGGDGGAPTPEVETVIKTVEGEDQTVIRTVQKTRSSEWPDYSGQSMHFVTDSNAEAAQRFYSRIVGGFEEATGAEVQLEFVTAGTSGMNRIIQLIQAGDPPEVTFMAAGNIYELVNNDLVAPINDTFDKIAGRLGEPAEAIKAVTSLGDDRYFVPLITNISTYTYRSDLSDIVPNTWEKAKAYAREVSEGDSGIPGTYVPVMTGSPSTVRFLAWLWSNEGSITEWDGDQLVVNLNKGQYRERAVEMLNFFKERQQWSPPASGAGWGDLINVIQTETAASAWYAGARAKNAAIRNDRPFADDVHVTPWMPENRARVAEGSAEGLLAFKNSNTEMAKTFIDFMFTKENLIDFLVNLSPVHNIPAWTDVARSDEYRSALRQTTEGAGWSEEDLDNYQVKAVEHLRHKTMEGGTTDPPNPYPGIYYSEPIWNLEADVLLKGEDPDDVIDQRARELQAQLDDVQGTDTGV